MEATPQPETSCSIPCGEDDGVSLPTREARHAAHRLLLTDVVLEHLRDLVSLESGNDTTRVISSTISSSSSSSSAEHVLEPQTLSSNISSTNLVDKSSSAPDALPNLETPSIKQITAETSPAPVLFYCCHNDEFVQVICSELTESLCEKNMQSSKSAVGLPDMVTKSIPLLIRLDCVSKKRKSLGGARSEPSTTVQHGIQYSTFESSAFPPHGQLPFPDGHFSTLVLVAPLESLDRGASHSKLFAEMSRILVDGGRIFMADRLLKDPGTMLGPPSLDYMQQLMVGNFRVDSLRVYDSDTQHFVLTGTK